MTNREHIIFRPSLRTPPAAAAKVRAREERELAKAGRRRGILGRMARRRAARKARKRASASKSKARKGSVIRRGAAGVGRAAYRYGTSRVAGAAVATPIGAILTGVAAAMIVATRLVQGKPLENLGNELEKTLLGDVPVEARATMATRRQFQNDRDLSRIAGQEGGKPNSQLQAVFEDLKQFNRRDEIGATALRREFPANGVLDMLILRARDEFLSMWKSLGLDSKVDQLREDYGEMSKRAKSGR